MRLITFNTKSPEENIAVDEILLKEAELGSIGGTIRFWESSEYFVVLGRAGKLEEECEIQKCLRDKIKIIRRLSGGGTVLQGPGCINYSLILSYDMDARYTGIISSYEAILGKIVKSFLSKGIELEYLPVSDIALSGKKVSGNAQTRKKKYFLHHGTFLSHFEIDKISEYIKHPQKQPAYRKNRLHEKFVANLEISSQDIINVIKDAYKVEYPKVIEFPEKFLKNVRKLAADKYSSDKWNKKF